MNTYTHQMEILLVANAGFFSKNWVKNKESAADKKFTPKEKLMDACWNGLVPELLPEFFDASNKNTHKLWEINDTNAFVNIIFRQGDAPMEEEFLLNPYIIMEFTEFN